MSRSARLCFLFAILLTLTGPVTAQPVEAPEDLEKKQKVFEGRYEEVRQRLADEKERVRALLGREGSLLDELDRVNNLLNARTRELRRLNRQDRALKEDVDSTERAIADLSDRIEKQKTRLSQRLKSLYHHFREGEIAALVSTGDYHAFIKESKLLGYLTHADRLLIESFRKNREDLEAKKTRLVELREEIRLNLQRVEEKKKEIELEKGKKEILLSEVRRSKDHAERLVRELDEAAERLKELIRKTEEERRIAEVLAGRIDFKQMKGRLPSPVLGRVTVKFGRQIDPLFDTPIFRNGIEIQTAPGEYVRAVHNGAVVFADWFKGYGQLIILSHPGGYHTLYAQLSEMYVQLGNTVGPDQVLGRVGNTGSFAGPTLYFELREKGRPVDPLGWLEQDARRSERALYVK